MYSDEKHLTLVIFEKQQSVFLLNFSKSVNSNYPMRLLRISSALLILLTAYTDALAEKTNQCESSPGWFEWRDHCYYLSQSPGQDVSWYGARDWCFRNGGNLASVLSNEENTFLKYLLANRKNHSRLDSEDYWLGYTSINVPKEYRWSDGSQASFTNWGTMTSQTGDGKCVYMRSDTRPECFRQMSGDSTDENYAFHFGYWMNDEVEWCERKCGRVSSCNSYLYFAGSTVDLGKRFECRGIRNWNTSAATEQSSANNTSLISPTIRGIRINCLGKWFSSNCGNNRGFVCKREKGNTTPRVIRTETTGRGSCPAGYSSLSTTGKCFRVHRSPSAAGVTHQAAKILCRSEKYRSADLLSIHTASENEAVALKLNDTSDSSVDYWIGLRLDNTSHWLWTDNSRPDFFIWSTSNPHQGQCVSISANGVWRKDDCRQQKAYICQAIRDPVPPDAGMIAGITIGSVCILISIGLAIFLLVKSRKQQILMSKLGFSNQGYLYKQ